jgi:hypothetical protein
LQWLELEVAVAAAVSGWILLQVHAWLPNASWGCSIQSTCKAVLTTTTDQPICAFFSF